MSNSESAAILLELLLIGMRRLSEFAAAQQRMNAGGEAVSEEEIAKAGLAADAAILRARDRINPPS